ncbi:hypothetical protein GCM10012275_18940 [Longimycelium tulufanense]|uniref:Metallopeptidase family protein n=1 Tax=Longimycelium tulufanense TaxID=907463 RepID=A0A8J3C7A2_9PSEU|nr:hypothetical protein GCM10012275_18940 [Longimycelium tulufanense]
MVEMSRDRFEELVSEALDLVPPELATAMQNVVVLVEDRHESDPDLLGLYEGIALTERGTYYAGVLPDRIFIFREPILAICGDEDEVVDEVVTTVVQLVPSYTTLADVA